MIDTSHGVVGAAGDMGTSLRCLLSDTGAQVIGVDEKWQGSLNDWTKLWACDVIWLAIPRKVVDGLLEKKAGLLGSSQLVIDIC